jgi:hypothetical protein
MALWHDKFVAPYALNPPSSPEDISGSVHFYHKISFNGVFLPI